MEVKELIKILERLDHELEIKHYSNKNLDYAGVEEVGVVEDSGVKCYMIY